MASTNINVTAFEQVMAQLSREVRDGLRHGFFELTVACEMVNSRKRRLTISAGKKHQFTIPEDELSE